MIVFAAIVPHSPLLLPAIGKEHRSKLACTLTALEEIEQALYLAKIDTICMIAPHSTRYPDAFSINLSEKYSGNFQTFGDFSTTVSAQGDFLLMDHIQRAMREERVPFTLTTNAELDFGFGVPIAMLTSHLTSWKLIPVTPSMLDAKAHFDFGTQLKNILHSESRRVAVIASADLSHKAGEAAPGGPTPEGIAFDKAVCDAIEAGKSEPLLAMTNDVVDSVSQCGFRPIMTLLGTINEMNIKPKKLCYEAPFGVGYLTVRYDVQ